MFAVTQMSVYNDLINMLLKTLMLHINKITVPYMHGRAEKKKSERWFELSKRIFSINNAGKTKILFNSHKVSYNF